MITRTQLVEWRLRFNNRYITSAIDEYCPEEFGQLLDELERIYGLDSREEF